MWCRSCNRAVILFHGLGNLFGGRGLDDDLVDVVKADRLRRVGDLGGRQMRIDAVAPG